MDDARCIEDHINIPFFYLLLLLLTKANCGLKNKKIHALCRKASLPFRAQNKCLGLEYLEYFVFFTRVISY